MNEEEVLEVIQQAKREGWTTLDLRGEGLRVLPDEIGKLIRLNKLRLDRNDLDALPVEIGRLTNLEQLDLDSNQLSLLPAEIGQLTNLERLTLGGNKLSALPAEIGQLVNLEWLALSSNQVSTLPPEIGNLAKLEALWMDDNQLESLPAEIGWLTHLTKLILGGNRLTTLPAEIGRLTQLKFLELTDNQINHLPKELGRLDNLDVLNLKGNPLPIAEDILGKTEAPAEIIKAYFDYLEGYRRLKVFLCHSSGDKPQVRELYRRLREEGIDPWLDEENLIPGQDWQIEIPKAVKKAHAVLVCLSNKSITKEGYVQKEIKFALDAADEKPEGVIFLIPVKLEPCQVPGRLSRWQWVNYYEEGSYKRLLKALKLRAESLGLEGPRG